MQTSKELVIGVLGGMGPEAGVLCLEKILKNTPAAKDQDHLRVVLDSNPKVPDRTQAILGQGESCVPEMVRGCGALQRAGADFVIIPCISAHMFLEEVRAGSPLPILSILDVVAEGVEKKGVEKVGLLGTTGTVRGGAFQKRLEESGVETLVPDEAGQARVMQAIYAVKDTAGGSRARATEGLAAEASALVGRGALGIVAGCTEVPLALQQEHVSVPYFDSLDLLARAAIRRAGREPVEDPWT